MEKFFKFLFLGAFALFAFASCSDDEENVVNPDTPGVEYDEAYYASHATVSSSDSQFTSNGEGGAISFKTEGGSVVVDVDCGTPWTAQNHASDVFGCTVQSAGITVTAEQNLLAEELTGSITLMTTTSGIEFATITLTQKAYGAPEITVSATEWNAPAVGDVLSTEIGVEANYEWTIDNQATWLTAEKSSNGLTLTVAENAEAAERTAAVVLTCSDEFNSDTATITVTQDGLAYITPSVTELAYDDNGGDAAVTVDSNFDWTGSTEATWITLTKGADGATLTVTVSKNESDAREGTIVLTAGDGAANVAEAQIKVTQEEYSKAFILLYTTPSANAVVVLPLDTKYGTVNCTVDWGDGSAIETVTAEWPSHTYAAAGDYEVRVEGTVTALNSNGPDTTSLSYLTGVKSWGDMEFINMYFAFYYASNLKTLPATTGNTMAKVTNFQSAFKGCTSLVTMPEDFFSKCTALTNIQNCFENCSALTTAPSFAGCTALKTVSYVFEKCTALKTLPKGMFSGCSAITTFVYCFAYCDFETVDEDLFADCPLVTTFASTFRNNASLKSLPEKLFANNPLVTTFGNEFYDCESLTSIPGGLFANNPEVTTFTYTFRGCTGLTSIPPEIFDNNTLVTTFSYTFYKCSNLTSESPYTLLSDGTTKVHLYERENYPELFTTPTTTGSCFNGCTGLTDYSSIPSGWR